MDARTPSPGRRIILAGFGGFLAAATTRAGAAAQNTEGKPARKEKDLVAGEKEAKKLLLLMDKDQNDMVSKEEFMSFMEAEFDRLDKDKSGQLDVKELTESRVRSSGAVHR